MFNFVSEYSLTKSMKTKSILILTSVVLSGCISAKLILPAQSDVDRVKEKFPAYTLEQLNSGKQLYETHCGNCHSLKRPGSRNEEQWKSDVPRMVKLINKKSSVVNDKEEDLILKYLITMSSVKQ